MTIRKVPLATGEYFHVYNRGNSKQEIFLDDKDRERFVKLLYLCNSKKKVNFRDDIVDCKIDAWDFKRGETLVSIGAWVLMPNHFHIYITSKSSPKPGLGEGEEGKSSITLFMHKLSVCYAKYFNTKYNRTGCLYEGCFKSTHIISDEQSKYLFSYIHLNPVKLFDSSWKGGRIIESDAVLNYLNNYKWSSFEDYCGILRKENKILDLKDFPEYFSNTNDFKEEILMWINFKNLPLNPV